MERWSVRTLRKKIDSMLFERTALSQKRVGKTRLMEAFVSYLHLAHGILSLISFDPRILWDKLYEQRRNK